MFNYRTITSTTYMTICSLLFLLISCGTPEYSTKYYKSISYNQQDTAFLKLEVSKEVFYGKYQIRYKNHTVDDGTLQGHVVGDTLIGKYTYLSRENIKSAIPIAFLQSDTILKLGTGVYGSYLGLNVFKHGTISFPDTLFRFHPITSDFYFLE